MFNFKKLVAVLALVLPVIIMASQPIIDPKTKADMEASIQQMQDQMNVLGSQIYKLHGDMLMSAIAGKNLGSLSGKTVNYEETCLKLSKMEVERDFLNSQQNELKRKINS